MDTVLKDNLREELDRSNLQEQMALEVLEKSPKGYLIKKKINNKTYYYIQWRENNKVKSKYVKKDQEKETKILFAQKKGAKKLLKIARYNKQMLERALND